MKIPIVKDGYRFIVPLGLLTIALWAVALPLAAVVCGLLFLFVTYFFRDPEREIPSDPNVIVSPADGKVVAIVQEKDPFMGKTFTRISIFLSVFNVHVNRVPLAGRIEKKRYNHGKFLAAFNHKASLDNEQSILLIKSANAEIVVKQIAGLIARRIVCWANEGDHYELGQRYGLIRFGSRVDIFVPEGSRLTVKIGDHVQGGSSRIGYLP